jgi:putative transposase
LILPAEVEMAADPWVRYQPRHQRILTGRFSRERFIQTATVKYLNNVIEQDHRAIKRRTRPMLGFKDFHCARVILSGIEVMHMIKKGQMKGSGEIPLSAAHRFYSLAS